MSYIYPYYYITDDAGQVHCLPVYWSNPTTSPVSSAPPVQRSVLQSQQPLQQLQQHQQAQQQPQPQLQQQQHQPMLQQQHLAPYHEEQQHHQDLYHQRQHLQQLKNQWHQQYIDRINREMRETWIQQLQYHSERVCERVAADIDRRSQIERTRRQRHRRRLRRQLRQQRQDEEEEEGEEEGEENDQCLLCKEDLNNSGKIIKLPCGHTVHGRCLQPWNSYPDICPVCLKLRQPRI